MNTLQSIARHYLASLENNQAEKIDELIDAANHSIIGSHDYYRLSFITEALRLLAVHQNVDEAIASLSPDKTIPELIAWLGSHQHRFEYLEHSPFVTNGITGFELIQDAQRIEKMEVFNSLIAQLTHQTNGDK